MSKGLEALKKLPATTLEEAEAIEVIEKELKASEIAIEFINSIADLFKEHDLEELEDKITKTHEALEILKAFDFDVEDYTEELNGSVSVKFNRIILDEEEIDVLKEVLL